MLSHAWLVDASSLRVHHVVHTGLCPSDSISAVHEAEGMSPDAGVAAAIACGPPVMTRPLDAKPSDRPASPGAYVRLGLAWLERGRAGDASGFGFAERAFRRAVDVPGPHVVGRIARAQAWFWIGELAKGRDWPAAVRAFRHALHEDPRDQSGGYAWMSAMALADGFRQRGEWDQALHTARVAQHLPDLYGRHLLASVLLVETAWCKGDVPAAQDALRELRSRYPASADVSRLAGVLSQGTLECAPRRGQ
jgi:hypothetical protein